MIFDFNIPSLVHENYVKYLLNLFFTTNSNKTSNNENEINDFFVNCIYKDFKTFDYEEYELQFLSMIKSLF